MAVVHTYFYIVVDTQRGCHTLKFFHDSFPAMCLFCLRDVALYEDYSKCFGVKRARH